MRRVAFAALTLVAAACGGGDEEAQPTTTATAAEALATSTSTSPPISTTTTASPAACPEVPPAIAGGTAEGSALDADVDGDGFPDLVSTIPLAGGSAQLRVDLGAGGSVVEDLADQPDHPATIESAADLGGDGSEELWVEVAVGASTDIYALYRLEGCDLVAVLVDGRESRFSVGGSVLLLEGLRCDDAGRLVHLGATSDDGESFRTLDLVYELRDGELVPVDDATGTLTAADEALRAYSAFDC